MFKIVGILNPFRLRRPRLGWKPNLVDHRDWDFETLGLSAANTRTVSLRHLVSQVLSQKNTSSCVAHAVAGAIDVLETKAG
ncbi:MAG: hypothetical protein GY854_03365, partial [Deltaproteobacteria bacterium]|nr:hypothetical protein [Deltaproteobacteria bacterium]